MEGTLMGDTPMQSTVPTGYSALIFRSDDDIAEATEVQKEHTIAENISTR